MQRGQALPATAGRSGTSIFAFSENANESLTLRHKEPLLFTRTRDIFAYLKNM
jgi:hypothetical protein